MLAFSNFGEGLASGDQGPGSFAQGLAPMSPWREHDGPWPQGAWVLGSFGSLGPDPMGPSHADPTIPIIPIVILQGLRSPDLLAECLMGLELSVGSCLWSRGGVGGVTTSLTSVWGCTTGC